MKGKFSTTVREPEGKAGGQAATQELIPGLLLVYSLGQPKCVPLPLIKGQLEIGRGEPTDQLPADPKLSRRHATVSFDGERFQIVDHGSQNGTFVDGGRVQQSLSSATARVLRTGDSLFVFCGDLRALQSQSVVVEDELVIGPKLRAVLEQAVRAARFGKTLHITGETGSGKEGVARAFYKASERPSGPFVAINCATIASGVAERLLFGARRGAYSGAVADTEGLIQSADGGTLFLDEVGELDLAVQAKLLRVLETREVLAMGALRPRLVNLQLCSASLRDLRVEMTRGRFREDLYFRISRPEVVVPPLRQRLEEVPWLVARALRTVSPELVAHSTFVETCLLRAWPGNVRELLAETRAAAQNALGLGARLLEASHLDPRAGVALARSPEPLVNCALLLPSPVAKGMPRPLPERARVEEALAQSGGNISATARLLGLHRTQLKRLFEKLAITPGRSDQSLEEDLEE